MESDVLSNEFDNKTRKFDPRLIFWLLSFVKQERALVILACALVLGSAGLGLVGPWLTQMAIDKYILKGLLEGLLVLCGAFMALQIFGFFVKYAQIYLMTFIGQRIMFRLRHHILSHVLQLPKRYFDKTPTGRIMTRVTTDVEALNELLSSGLMVLLSDSLMLCGIVVILFLKHWQLALVTFSTIPLILAGSWAFRRKIIVIYRKEREIISRINTFLQESLSGMSVIQLFNRQKFNCKQFVQLNNDYCETNLRAVKAFVTFFPFISFLSIFCKALIVWYGGMMFINHSMTIGAIVAFLSYVEMFFAPIRDLSEKYNIFQAAMAASEKIHEVLDEPKGSDVTESGTYLGPVRGSIEFKNVWFAYDGINPVLKDISFSISQGETIAIVGHTGSGKTTIINLIGKFYPIQQGSILVDGVDIRHWNTDSLRSGLGIVLQDVLLFSGSLFDNISLFDTTITRAQVEEAVTRVNAGRFVASLPHALNTQVLERGGGLSTGQRQLVSFARTLCRNPPMLILDEATANIDSETERDIQEALKFMTKERTSIVIAHRLSTIRNADRILVLHHGKLRESGTHEELVAQNGIYHDLYELQYTDGI